MITLPAWLPGWVPWAALGLILIFPPALFGWASVFAGLHSLGGRQAARELSQKVFRLMTGDHLDGRPRNNRTAFTPATKPLRGHADLPMSRLARAPRYQRAAAAWALAWLLPLWAYGLLLATTLTLALTAATWAAAACWAGLAAARWIARRHHRTHVVRPLAAALAHAFGHHRSAIRLRVRPRLEILQPGDEAIRVDALPDSYRTLPRERDTVQQIIGARMPPFVRLNWDWQTDRHPMRLIGIVAAAPPVTVPAIEYLDLIDSLGTHRYFLGVAAEGIEQIWDTTDEDPHGLVIARTRIGKTNINLAVAAQALRRGERVTYIDPKRVSAICLLGIPGYTLACDPADVAAMWDAIHTFRLQMDDAIAGHGDGIPHTLIIDEVPQFYRLSRDHWMASRLGGRVSDMAVARDLSDVVHQGGQFGFRVLVDGQDLKQADLFGYRQAFGTALAAGYTPAQWNYTIGTKPVPPVPSIKGRFYLTRAGSDPVLTQIVCGDPRGRHHNENAWRDLALGGVPTPPEPPRWRAWAEPPHRRRDRAALPWADRKALPALIQGPAQATAYLGFRSTQAFTMARRRHPIEGEFKTLIKGVETACWTRETLDHWDKTRPRRAPRAKADA